MGSKNAPTALPEPPADMIRQAAEQHPEVYLVIRRQDVKGTWASLPSFTRATAELADGGLEEYLRKMPGAGGGRYRVQALSVHDHNESIIPAYYTTIAGAANAPSNPQGPAQSRFGGGGAPVMPWQMTPQMPVFPPRYGEEQPHFDPANFMSQTPDAIAMHFNSQMQVELAQIRKDRETERQRYEERIEAEREKARKYEVDLQEMRRQNEVRMLELRLEMLSDQRSQPETKSSLDYAGLVAAMAPIITALLQSNTSKITHTTEAQQKSMEMQFQGLRAMMELATAGSKKEDGSTKMLEVIMPLILSREESNSPSKMADFMASMADANMHQLSLVSQIMQNLLPEGDDPLTQLVTTALEGIQDVATAFADKKAGGTPQMTAGPQQQQQPRGLSQTSTPAEFADAIWNSPGLRPEFRTKGWYNCFLMMHDRAVDPEQVASYIARTLDAAYDAKAAPPSLAPIIDDDVEPSSVLRPFLQQLPIGQWDPKRLDDICIAFDEAYREEEDEEEPEKPHRNGRAGPAFAPSQIAVLDAEGEPVEKG